MNLIPCPEHTINSEGRPKLISCVQEYFNSCMTIFPSLSRSSIMYRVEEFHLFLPIKLKVPLFNTIVLSRPLKKGFYLIHPVLSKLIYFSNRKILCVHNLFQSKETKSQNHLLPYSFVTTEFHYKWTNLRSHSLIFVIMKFFFMSTHMCVYKREDIKII